MRRHRSASLADLAVLALLLFATAPTLYAQETLDASDLESFAEEIAVEVVNVEVWVTDRQGRPVTGLTRDDFELFEDGEPVAITNFTVFEGAATAAPPAGPEAVPAEAPPGEEAPPPAEEDRLHLTVFVDNWTLTPADRARVLQDLRVFLQENLAPEDRVAVAVHDRALQLVQEFTTDREAVDGALDRIEGLAPSGTFMASERRSALGALRGAWEEANAAAVASGTRGAPNPQGAGVTGLGGAGAGGPCTTAWGDLQGVAIRYAAAITGHAQRSAGALASISQILSGLPGRRVLLYVGNGLAQTPGIEIYEMISELCPERRSELAAFQQENDLSWLYEEVATRANAARVTFYTIEARSPAVDLDMAGGPGGLSGVRAGSESTALDSAASSHTPAVRLSPHVQRLADLDQEAPLELMARETGGRAILNAGDFAADLARIAADLRHYYSLGFSPDHSGDGRLHRLRVRLADGGDGYRVRHRLTYRDQPVAERMVDRVRSVAQFGLAPNPLGARVEVGEAVPLNDGTFRVPLRIWVPLAELVLLPAGDDAREGRLRVLMTTTDERGELVPARQQVVPVRLAGAAPAAGEGGEKLVEVSIDLPAGSHHVALGVRDEVGGEVSYLRARFDLPGGPEGIALKP